MNSTFKNTLLFAASLLLVGQACIQIRTGGSGDAGGLFKSVDGGVNWTQKSSIASVSAPRGFGNSNVTDIAFDPGDPNAIYAGTSDLGLMYSYDKGESWRVVPALGTVWINAVAVSPDDKCVIYAAVGRRIAKSRDCARTWEDAYFDARADAQVSDIVVDFFNANTVYAATSKGDVLKSLDAGASWSTVQRVDSEIRQLLMAAGDSRVVFAVTRNRGLWKTTDAGAAWTDLTRGFGDFSGSLDGMILVQAISEADTYIAASHFGLLRSTDGGQSWKAIPLVTPSGSTVITSLTVSPRDQNRIWYGTASNLFRSEDGGSRWKSDRLPTSRAATDLAVDPSDPSVLYMGTTLIEQRTTPF